MKLVQGFLVINHGNLDLFFPTTIEKNKKFKKRLLLGSSQVKLLVKNKKCVLLYVSSSIIVANTYAHTLDNFWQKVMQSVFDYLKRLNQIFAGPFGQTPQKVG